MDIVRNELINLKRRVKELETKVKKLEKQSKNEGKKKQGQDHD